MVKRKKFIHFNPGIVGNKKCAVFMPAVTIHCEPPYIAGKIDSCWCRYKDIDTHNQEQCENVLGMKLLPLEEK